MTYSIVQYPIASPTTGPFNVTFPYISKSHVEVRKNGTLLTDVTDYSWPTSSTIQLTASAAINDVIEFRRVTSRGAPLVDFNDGAKLPASDLDTAALHALYLAQEAFDAAEQALTVGSSGHYEAGSKRITGLANAVGAQDAVTYSQLLAAALAPVTPTAGSIANVPSGNLVSSNVQAALNELMADIDAVNAGLSSKANLSSPAFTGNPTAPTPTLGDNDTSIATTAFVTSAIAANPSVLPLSLQDGGRLSNNTVDAVNDIDISAGLWASDDATASNRTQLLIPALTKQLDAAWVVGSNQGMRDTGTIANGTWHIYAIKRMDTGVVDVLASLTPDRPPAVVTMTIASPAVVSFTGHGLVAGASFQFSTTGALPTGVTAGTTYFVISSGLTADTFQFSATQGGAAVNTSGSQSGVHTCTPTPVMPANYTKKRRLGSILREAATIVPFVQDGDSFVRRTVVLDVSTTGAASGVSAVTRTLSVPTGLRLNALLSSMIGTNVTLPGIRFYLSDLSQVDNAASDTFFTNSACGQGSGSADDYTSTDCAVFTNYSAQIRSRINSAGAGDVIRISTRGWVDTRGRNS